MLTPERQAVLDDLYWNTTRSMKSIGAELDLPSHQISKLASPVPSDLRCWWCHEMINFRSRSERTNRDRRQSFVHCPCGASQPDEQRSEQLVPSEATIIIPDPLSKQIAGSHWYGDRLAMMSGVVREGVRALDQCGLRWSGRFAVIDVSQHPTLTRRALEELPNHEIVIPTLRDLATNEGDSLALFFRLVLDEWRVITTVPTRSNDGWNGGGWYDEMVPMWSRSHAVPDDLPTSPGWWR